MKSTIGKNLIMTISGGSHEESVDLVLEGVPAGHFIDFDNLQSFLLRRAPGNSIYTTPRKEDDIPVFFQGFDGNITNGLPIKASIFNTNIKPGDYNLTFPRPGHADYTAHEKYGNSLNMSGGGPFSGRMTAPMCIAGGIALQILSSKGITVSGEIFSIGKVIGGPEMFDEILKAKENSDSVGGVVLCRAENVPPGLGGPMFDGAEGKLASLFFGIPAVKAVEFGSGFDSSKMRGSQNNDEFYFSNNQIKTYTNNHGGILGGITSGMPIIAKVAFKPTPSIGKEQRTVNLIDKTEVSMKTEGRHDPCVVPRAVPVVEGLMGFAILDLMLD